jgi:hypothetical protein
VRKRNRERKECEEKEKKRKEVRGDQHIKVVEVRSLNLDLDLLWKDLEVKLGEVIEHYRTLLFWNFQKKRICFLRVAFENSVLDLVFWSYLLCLSFFGSATLGSYRSYRNICVRKISCHLDLYWERSKHLKFQSHFWGQFLLKVISFCGHH